MCTYLTGRLKTANSNKSSLIIWVLNIGRFSFTWTRYHKVSTDITVTDILSYIYLYLTVFLSVRWSVPSSTDVHSLHARTDCIRFIYLRAQLHIKGTVAKIFWPFFPPPHGSTTLHVWSPDFAAKKISIFSSLLFFEFYDYSRCRLQWGFWHLLECSKNSFVIQ